jgi:uncharacterized protein YgiB involved in biofilm formation
MKPTVITRRLVVAVSALAVAGCGDGGGTTPKVEAKQFVVVSAVDCADNTGLEFEKCISVLQKAIALHDRAAPTYPKIEACETAEGEGRCERVGEKSYRARVTAFQMTLSEKPAAIPLYAPKTNIAGLRTASNTEILPDAETFTFTESAADASHLYFTEDPKKKKK